MEDEGLDPALRGFMGQVQLYPEIPKIRLFCLEKRAEMEEMVQIYPEINSQTVNFSEPSGGTPCMYLGCAVLT